MAEMKTDAAALSAEAANFDRISGELKGVIANVDSTAGTLAAQWRGQAGAAAQSALLRFKEAGQKQIKELDDISSNISQSGIQYDAADSDQAGSLSSQMNI